MILFLLRFAGFAEYCKFLMHFTAAAAAWVWLDSETFSRGGLKVTLFWVGNGHSQA